MSELDQRHGKAWKILTKLILTYFLKYLDVFRTINLSKQINFITFVLSFIAVYEVDGSTVNAPSAEIHQGSVGAYNYTYYNFVTRRPGAALIILQTLFGDADLYVSQRENKHKPTYAFQNYDLHMTSCGLDVVEIEDLSLPVNIGIYGHPSYPFSNYSLAILVTKVGGTIDDLRQWMDDSELTIDDLPSFIEMYAVDDGEYHFKGSTFFDFCISVFKILFQMLELILEVLL